jgi:hypothetical protein
MFAMATTKEIQMNQPDTGWHGGDEAPPSESPNREAKKWRVKDGVGHRLFSFFTPHLFANLGGGDEALPSEGPNREAKKWRAKTWEAKDGIRHRQFSFFTPHLFANLGGGDEAPPSGVGARTVSKGAALS